MKWHNIWIIRNKTAGWRSDQKVQFFLKTLRKQGVHFYEKVTQYPGHAIVLAQEATEAQADLLIVIGGDGTLNEVVNGLAQEATEKNAVLPTLAVFPAGTVNLVAKELHIPENPRKFLKILQHGRVKTIWPAEANGRYFLAVLGIGFDAYIVSRVSHELKRHLSKMSYALQTLLFLARPWKQKYKVYIDGKPYEAQSLILSNSRFYGGSYTIVPTSTLTESKLYACLFHSGDPLDFLSYILYLVLNRLSEHKAVQIVEGRTFEIWGQPGQVVQVDGDALLTLPVCIRSGKIPLSVVVGES